MKFRYRKFPSGLRPVIPVDLISATASIGSFALVDSGADMSFFDAELAGALGLELMNGEKQEVVGVTGVPVEYYVHTITVRVGGHDTSMPVGFLEGLSNFGYGLVGQIGFFDAFIVKFDLLKEEIELKQRYA